MLAFESRVVVRNHGDIDITHAEFPCKSDLGYCVILRTVQPLRATTVIRIAAEVAGVI